MDKPSSHDQQPMQAADEEPASTRTLRTKRWLLDAETGQQISPDEVIARTCGRTIGSGGGLQ